MADKHIIKKFSDNHCLVLENNQISLREDEITAYQIVLDKSTNELLEFVKDTYLQLQAKEQECERLEKKQRSLEEALDEIGEIAKHNNFLVRDPFCGSGYRDLSEQILNIIDKAKEQ